MNGELVYFSRRIAELDKEVEQIRKIVSEMRAVLNQVSPSVGFTKYNTLDDILEREKVSQYSRERLENGQ